MVAVFGGVSAFVLAALVTGLVRFWRDGGERTAAPMPRLALTRALGDAATLKYLHPGGVDCTSAEEVRSAWRRWFHHLTFYGFMLCFASTSVAALYHVGFGWRAPYAYSSLPVVLGTAGGLGLLAGPAGLFFLQRTRDKALLDPAQGGLDAAFIILLLLTSLTGLVLLVLRNRAAMPALLIVHLGIVLALVCTLPYGKFVHGMYRTAALIKYGLETLKAREPKNSRPA
jgi:citrate/tricarballylate utilization protein